MKAIIEVTNAFNHMNGDPFYFVSCILRNGNINDNQNLYFENKNIGKVVGIENQFEKSLVLIVEFHQQDINFKIYNLYGKTLILKNKTDNE